MISKLLTKRNTKKERVQVVLQAIDENFAYPGGQEPTILKLEPPYWAFLFILSLFTAFFFIKQYFDHTVYLALFNGYDGGAYDLFIIYILFLSSLLCPINYYMSSHYARKKYVGRNRFLFLINSLTSAMAIFIYALGAYSYVTHNIHLENFFQAGFYSKLHSFEASKEDNERINALQKNMKCCGVVNYTEWFSVAWSKELKKNMIGFPESCCHVTTGDKICFNLVDLSELSRLTPWHEGCALKVQHLYSFNLCVVIILLSSLTVAYVIGFFFSFLNRSYMSQHEYQTFADWVSHLKRRVLNHDKLDMMLTSLAEFADD